MATAPVNPGGNHSPEGWGMWWWWTLVVLIILLIAVAFGLGGRRAGGRDTGMQLENSHHGAAAPAPHH